MTATTTRATPRPTIRGSCSTSRSASSSRSRRTRHGPSARPSSTRSATARCSSTWGPSTRRRTASCGSSSSSTARRSSTSTRSSATSIAASRSSCENADYHQAISQVDPLEYVSSLFCEWPPVMAFEKLLDVEVPRRAEYIRVLSAELNRIASHALFMGWMALDLGGLTPILWSFIERDEIVEMLAALTGQRMLFNYFRIGGVNGDLNHEFMSRLGDWMSRATSQIEANIGLLNENEIFVRRMRGLGTIDTATALRMCMTGPNLRATGVPFDVRRAHPYSRLPGARLRHPDPRRGRLPRPLPHPDRRDQAEPPDHRPVPPPDAGRPGHGQAAAAAAAAARSRIRGDRGTARAVRRVRHQRRHRPAVPDADPRPIVHPPPVRRRCSCRAT